MRIKIIPEEPGMLKYATSRPGTSRNAARVEKSIWPCSFIFCNKNRA
jgi:hypothetical protein